MIKGISRQIVEVTDTKSPYFERVFLVVRHQCTDYPSALLDKEAHTLLSAENSYSGLKKARRLHRFKQVAWLALGISLGLCLSLFLTKLS
ncbi:MAG: hypothetical protein J6Q42_00485 [Clostridia bacterium]|nr:hypothetical protein [Clostridia bacterium]